MITKKERFFQAFERLDRMICPVCAEKLVRRGEDLVCRCGHNLAVNRKGCVNVLTSPKACYYDAGLFEARERVFRAGCYDTVAQAIAAMLPEKCERVLDAGCGEGWYLERLTKLRPQLRCAGVDLSRDAILRATGHDCEAVWTIADLRRLPFADGAFDAVLDVLTPAGYAEFQRVLAPGGVLIKVYPGKTYLREIREKRQMPLYEEGAVDAYLHDHAKVLASEHVSACIAVTPALWRDFVWMTPLDQDLSGEQKEALAADPAATVTIDLHVTSCSL